MCEHTQDTLDRMPTDEEYELLIRSIGSEFIEQERMKILNRIKLFGLKMDPEREREYIDYRVRRFLVSEGLGRGIIC